MKLFLFIKPISPKINCKSSQCWPAFFVQGHRTHSREYSSDAKCQPVSCGPGSTQPHCASQDIPRADVPRGTKTLSWLRAKRWENQPAGQRENTGQAPLQLPQGNTKRLENTISNWAYTKLNDLNNSINCSGFLDRSGDGERITRRKKHLSFGKKWCSGPARLSLAFHFTHVPLHSPCVFILQKLHCQLNTLL